MSCWIERIYSSTLLLYEVLNFNIILSNEHIDDLLTGNVKDNGILEVGLALAHIPDSADYLSFAKVNYCRGCISAAMAPASCVDNHLEKTKISTFFKGRGQKRKLVLYQTSSDLPHHRSGLIPRNKQYIPFF